MDRVALLNHLLARRGGTRYLEIGCRHNRTFARVKAAYKWGVDPHSGGTHRMTSDEFFIDLGAGVEFDLVFVDGLHWAEQVERDVLNSLRHLKPDGSIVLHDCLPQTEAHQRRDPPGQGAWTGDVWKAVARLRSRADLDVAVFDADWGLGAVLNRQNTDPVVLPAALDWRSYLAEGRRLLRVLDWPEFDRFLG